MYYVCVFIIQNIHVIDTIITGLYQQSDTNMHIKQLFDCDKLYEHVTTSTANYDNQFKIKEKHLYFFWSNFGQSITGYKRSN